MTLPADVSRCQPAGLCLRRMRCARFIERTENRELERVPVTAFEPEQCEAFVPVDDGAREIARRGAVA